MKLLERHSRGVVPTPAGEELARHAREIAGRLEQARQAMRKYRGGEAVRVTLGITPSIVRLVGDDILMELAATIPNVTLGLVEEFSFVLMRQLERGEITCALTYAPEIPEGLAHRALLEEDLFFLTAPDLAPKEGEITFREVLTTDLALTGRQDAVFRIVEGIARRLGMELNVAYEVQSIRAVKNLVAKGVAATIMPYGAAEGELRSGALKRRLIVAPRVTRVLSFVHPREQAGLVDTPEFRAFVNAVADRLVRAEGPVARPL